MRANTLLSRVAVSVAVFAVSAVRAGAVPPPPTWASTMAEACLRCVAAASERERASVPLPERAVVYSFVGEFAPRAQWWLVDLDTGQITERVWVSGGAADPTVTVKHLGKVDTGALTNLRAAAARLWRSKPPREPGFAPGVVEEAYVISGSRMVAFSRLTPSDGYVVIALEAALKVADEAK
jgi:hypothetical protein